jgi:LysM repeat protein
VRHGETVRSIARRFDTTPEHLMRLNGLRKPVLFAGQELIVAGTPRKGRTKSSRRGSAKHSR